VTGLYLELCELSRFLTGQERNQSFKFSCRLVGVVSLSEHQMFKLPDCLIVIHISSFMKVWRETRNVSFAGSDGPIARQVFFTFAGGTSATAASVVSRRKVNVSCRYRRTAASVWLR
jgi:hypothetical protein